MHSMNFTGSSAASIDESDAMGCSWTHAPPSSLNLIGDSAPADSKNRPARYFVRHWSEFSPRRTRSLHDDRGLAVTEILGAELIIRGIRQELVLQHGRTGRFNFLGLLHAAPSRSFVRQYGPGRGVSESKA